jgi:hypothetical protein
MFVPDIRRDDIGWEKARGWILQQPVGPWIMLEIRGRSQPSGAALAGRVALRHHARTDVVTAAALASSSTLGPEAAGH